LQGFSGDTFIQGANSYQTLKLVQFFGVDFPLLIIILLQALQLPVA
jgi:hypothetical protein